MRRQTSSHNLTAMPAHALTCGGGCSAGEGQPEHGAPDQGWSRRAGWTVKCETGCGSACRGHGLVHQTHSSQRTLMTVSASTVRLTPDGRPPSPGLYFCRHVLVGSFCGTGPRPPLSCCRPVGRSSPFPGVPKLLWPLLQQGGFLETGGRISIYEASSYVTYYHSITGKRLHPIRRPAPSRDGVIWDGCPRVGVLGPLSGCAHAAGP